MQFPKKNFTQFLFFKILLGLFNNFTIYGTSYTTNFGISKRTSQSLKVKTLVSLEFKTFSSQSSVYGKFSQFKKYFFGMTSYVYGLLIDF